MMTQKQRDILEYIYIWQVHGLTPTYDEIREQFKLKSLNSIYKQVQALIKKGYLEKTRKSRSFHILKLN